MHRIERIQMVPYPEEIDLFSGPHTRMKQLVHLYLQKLSSTDFNDLNAVLAFLSDLQRIFYEFKSHENIENELIMRKLRSRLKSLSINDSTVCNCHSDSTLSEMLALVQKGYQCRKNDCFNYTAKLRRALHDFTDTFLPHMKEEEEVFQPMLIQYFDYEELKILKSDVVQRHERYKQHFEERDFLVDSDPFSSLPLEMSLEIFSFLKPSELVNCQKVCRRWREIVLNPTLWRDINLTNWIKDRGISASDQFSQEKCVCKQVSELDEEIYAKQNNFISGFLSNFLPLIGDSVCKLILSGIRGLTSQQLCSIIILCPNITHLDVSYTLISAVTFHSVGDRTLSKLSHLDLSGCCNVNDLTLINLKFAWQMSTINVPPNERGLKFLSLSGCHNITDTGLTHLSKCGILGQVVHLDLSGCFRLSGSQLRQLILCCTCLRPENLYYCFNIDEGPYQCEANGCNNIDSTHRFCCTIKNL